MRSLITPASQELILTAVGQDQPGIVAGAAKVLFETGCNIEDSNMAIVRGTFAMILSLSAPGKLRSAALLRKLKPLSRSMKLEFTLKPNPSRQVSKPAPSQHAIVSVYGADRPGIVYQVANTLAKRRINITQVNTKLVEHRDPRLKSKALYVMVLEVDVPKAQRLEQLRKHLKNLAATIGVDITILPHELLEL